MRNIYRLYTMCLAVAALSSCSKFIAVDPPFTSTSTDQVYLKDATAAATLTAIYTQMSQSDVLPGAGITSVPIDCGMYADEINFTGLQNDLIGGLWTNSLTPANSAQGEWGNMYNRIFEANAALEGLNASNALTPAIKQQLMGEAYFIRGFFYFYLVNLFGDVPLAVSTDYKANAQLSRAPQSQVYDQIISDFRSADSLLSADYKGADASASTSERVRPCKAAAETMLARAYLYQKKYPEAEDYATRVIENTSVYGLDPLGSVFLKNSRETIWSIPPPAYYEGQKNTKEGMAFILSENTNPGGPDFIPTDALLNSFEPGDMRKENWIGYGTKLDGTGCYYFYKYKIGLDQVPTAEYSVVLRLAELYLIRAEARAMQNNVPGAQDDLNAIRHRAGLGDTPAATQDALITAILHERQVELFTEWGNRFFDLKRLGKLDAVLGTEKSGWNTDDQYFPIPQQERDRDPNLTQNPGYN